MNHEPLCELTLDGVVVGDDARLLGAPGQGREILAWTLNRTTIAICAVVDGVAEQALRITAEYTTERKQFDPRSVRSKRSDSAWPTATSTIRRSSSRCSGPRPTSTRAATTRCEIAGPRGFWAADGGNHIGHAALHVHGGISIDLDFPIHRYFLWLKQYEFTLGAATPQLLRIGKVLADEPA